MTPADESSRANANPPFATFAVPSRLQSTIVYPSLFLNRPCASRISLAVIAEALHLQGRHAAVQYSFDDSHVHDIRGNKTFTRDTREERTDECRRYFVCYTARRTVSCEIALMVRRASKLSVIT